jgi:hypothetical protein
MEIFKENILDKAIELTDIKYRELKRTNSLEECTSIIVHHINESFWFSDENTADLTLNLFNTSNPN